MDFMKPSSRRGSRIEQNPVVYMDGSSLARPFDPPKYVLIIAGIAAAVALVAGIWWSSGVIDTILHGAQRNEATVTENLNREVSYDFPHIDQLISMDDASITQSFADSGFTTYSILAAGEEGIDLMKLPADTSLVDAAVAYGNGISNMDATTASEFLVGSWRFTCTRGDYIDMRLRYADFKSVNATEAIEGAVAAQGWADNANVTVTDEGEDEVGNTYREGTVTTDGGTYTWRVSVCPLGDIYGISGLPDTAQYVGIRMTA